MTTTPLPVGESVFVVFPGAKIPRPLKAEIRWSKDWGKTREAPGMGIKFLEPNIGDALPDLKRVRRYREG